MGPKPYGGCPLGPTYPRRGACSVPITSSPQRRRYFRELRHSFRPFRFPSFGGYAPHLAGQPKECFAGLARRLYKYFAGVHANRTNRRHGGRVKMFTHRPPPVLEPFRHTGAGHVGGTYPPAHVARRPCRRRRSAEPADATTRLTVAHRSESHARILLRRWGSAKATPLASTDCPGLPHGGSACGLPRRAESRSTCPAEAVNGQGSKRGGRMAWRYPERCGCRLGEPADTPTAGRAQRRVARRKYRVAVSCGCQQFIPHKVETDRGRRRPVKEMR